ncbi:MAG: hypothetical protein H6740_10135, partial [Alphaproteobacteria bacterium]|nr:hypothetical protein [Alphaproteobacteria bacterium]
GATMCSNFALKDKVAEGEKKVANLTAQNDQLNDLANKPITEFRYEDLAQRITGSVALAAALKDDAPLLGRVKKKARVVFANPAPYRWLVDPNSKRNRTQDFTRYREAIEGNDNIDGDTARLLPYTAAIGDLSQDKFAVLVDSEGEDVCGYGPLALTYRQARNFGMDVALDAYIPGTTSQYEGEGAGVARRELFKQTADAARLTEEQFEEAADGESTIFPVGKENCLHMDLDDDRNTTSRVVSKLGSELGPKGVGLPSTDENASVLARLSKFYVADWARADFSDRRAPGFDLGSAVPSVALEDAGDRGQWVLDNTADVIAKSMVLPCIAVLEYAQEQKELQVTFGDQLPSPIDCLVLKWKLDNEG